MSDHLHEVISVIGCGPSALECGAATAPGYVIAVNGAFEYVKHNAVLSMDGRFAANKVPSMFGHVPIWLRYRAFNHVDVSLCSHAVMHAIKIFKNVHAHPRFAENANYPTTTWQLNGDHSGYCALNLAYSMQPKTVYLYGFDLNDEDKQHFFGKYPWFGQGSTNSRVKFAKWRTDMHEAARQFKARGIRVINTNPSSAIDAFEFGKPA